MALSMGLGKTGLSLAIKDSIPGSKMLVVCPAYLVLNWKKEALKFLESPSITVFKKGSESYLPFDSEIVITSYDLAIKNEFLFEWADILICDEATHLKGMDAKRTKAIHKLVFENSIKRVHLLTGTPIKNRVEEFYSLMTLCYYNPKFKDPKFLKDFPNKISFADHFSYRKEYSKFISGRLIKILNWEGFRENRENELKDNLKGIYRSRRSSLPKCHYKDIVVSDHEDPELLEEFYSFVEGSGINPKTKCKAAQWKVPHTLNHIKELQSSGEVEGPILVFTDHRESCKELAAEFGVPPITGEMTPSNRQKMADDFQAGRIPVMVATYGSFGMGYTLTISNIIVQNDYPWVPGDMAQAEARINRIGQTRPCYVHRILGSPQDEYILNTILEKSKVLDKVF